MILLGLGSNLVMGGFKTSGDVLEAAIKSLVEKEVKVVGRSPWYRSAPIPVSDLPWFINGVVAVSTDLSPNDLLQVLHAIEHEFGRVRVERNGSRTLDLDLLAYDERVQTAAEGAVLPHPRLQDRAFVLMPLADLAPEWRHPITGRTAAEMLEILPPGQDVERLD
ncbi:MAG: 2-amino-4-hydroxy-6-hydroxymethyldihydropteridine diphosphokinase [Kiloniellaceae bacterium]